MCWPRERPATHAAAGAAARGVRGFGGFFHMLWSDGTRRFLVWGILLRLDWEPLREHVLTTGVVRHACRLRRECERIPLELRWEGKPALRRGLCLFRGRLRERECEAELRGTHSQAELRNDTELFHPRRRAVSCEAELRIPPPLWNSVPPRPNSAAGRVSLSPPPEPGGSMSPPSSGG